MIGADPSLCLELDELPGLQLGRCPGCSRPMVVPRYCGECHHREHLRGLDPSGAAHRVMSVLRERCTYQQLRLLVGDLDKPTFDGALSRLLKSGRAVRLEVGVYEPRRPGL